MSGRIFLNPRKEQIADCLARLNALPPESPYREEIAKALWLAAALNVATQRKRQWWLVRAISLLREAEPEAIQHKRRAKGGRSTGERKKQEAGSNRQRIVEMWQRHQKASPRERAGIIALALGLDPKTVRRHLKGEGLMTPKNKTGTS